jgi:OOP family OmpA-OmpF porin
MNPMKTIAAAVLLMGISAGAAAHHYGPYYGPRHHFHYGPVYGPPVYYEPRIYYAYPPPPPPPIVIERRYVEVMPPPPPRPVERARPVPPPPVEPKHQLAPVPRLERMTLSATELFEFDKATIRGPQPKLDEIARVLNENAHIDSVRITGYTDRLGTEAYNLRLSQRRAEIVKAYLVDKGVSAKRLVALGKGEANPVVQCNQKDRNELIKCLEPNRRVEVEQITVEKRGGR